jgi:cell division initiation protein
MNVSPLDLRNPRFRTSFRGFDQVEVTSFLAAVADDYEQALRETDRLRQDVTRLEALLNEHREHENNLRNTLLTAQRLSDEIKTHAGDEASRIVREAEGRAELLLQKTQFRLDDLHHDIDNLLLKRRDVETSIETTILTLRSTLEHVRESSQRNSNNEKVLVHRPRAVAEPAAVDTAPVAVSR